MFKRWLEAVKHPQGRQALAEMFINSVTWRHDTRWQARWSSRGTPWGRAWRAGNFRGWLLCRFVLSSWRFEIIHWLKASLFLLLDNIYLLHFLLTLKTTNIQHYIQAFCRMKTTVTSFLVTQDFHLCSYKQIWRNWYYRKLLNIISEGGNNFKVHFFQNNIKTIWLKVIVLCSRQWFKTDETKIVVCLILRDDAHKRFLAANPNDLSMSGP